MENCKKTYNFFEYLENGMDAGSKKELENHLLVCRECNEAFSKVQCTLEFIEKEKSIKENPFLFIRIEAKLAKKALKLEKIQKRVLQPALLCSITILSVLCGYFVSGSIYSSSASPNKQEYGYFVMQEPIETTLLDNN